MMSGACSLLKLHQSESPAVSEGPAAGTDLVPVSLTSNEATPVSPSQSQPSLTENYTVLRGDTLMKIAFHETGNISNWKTIYEDNRDQLKDPSVIPIGTILKVTQSAHFSDINNQGEKYLIQEGDTLRKISQHLYGTVSKWKEIWENNKQLIQDPDKIFAGFYLSYVPHEVPADSGQRTPSSTTSKKVNHSKLVVPHFTSDTVGSIPTLAAPSILPGTGSDIRTK